MKADKAPAKQSAVGTLQSVQPEDQKIVLTVVAIEGQTNFIEKMEFKVNDQTSILNGEQAGGLEGLASGDRVRVAYDEPKLWGAPTAREIEVIDQNQPGKDQLRDISHDSPGIDPSF